MNKVDYLDNDMNFGDDYYSNGYDYQRSYLFAALFEDKVPGLSGEDIKSIWESCEYRCEICNEDQCFCEDGYIRKAAHQSGCEACQFLLNI